MTGPTSNDLNIARAAGAIAADAGDARESCLWESGPMRDAWLAAYDAHAGEPLHKVLPAGGPMAMPAHPFLPIKPQKDSPCWNCHKCGLISTVPTRSDCLSGIDASECPMVAP